jgi:hypothetical protein
VYVELNIPSLSELFKDLQVSKFKPTPVESIFNGPFNWIKAWNKRNVGKFPPTLQIGG